MGTSDKVFKYVIDWERKCYTDGIPDEVENEISHICPSYKKIAICLLKNDYNLTDLGYSQPYSKWYDTLKKIELHNKGNSIQLKLL